MPECVNSDPICLEFIVGLIYGDGSFNFAFYSTRRRVVANFTVIQDVTCDSVLHFLTSFLAVVQYISSDRILLIHIYMNLFVSVVQYT